MSDTVPAPVPLTPEIVASVIQQLKKDGFERKSENRPLQLSTLLQLIEVAHRTQQETSADSFWMSGYCNPATARVFQQAMLDYYRIKSGDQLILKKAVKEPNEPARFFLPPNIGLTLYDVPELPDATILFTNSVALFQHDGEWFVERPANNVLVTNFNGIVQ